jgi:bile acid:Na+ symporter, BASS family
MVDSLSGLFAGLVFVTVALTAFSIGLLTTWDGLLSTVRRRAFAIVLVANVVVIPVVGWLLVGWFDLSSDLATGILLCSICAAGPVALKASQIARSDLVWALSLTGIMLAANVITLPLWSSVLIDQAVAIRPTDLVGVLVLAILVPVLLGAWPGRRSSDPDRLSRVAASISNVTLVAAIGVGIAGNIGDLAASFASPVFPISLSIIALAGLIGWIAADTALRRRTSSLVTLNRATSVALLVVGRAFPDRTQVFAAVVVFGLIQTVVALGIASYWRWIRTIETVVATETLSTR